MSTVCWCGRPECPSTTFSQGQCTASLRAEVERLRTRGEALAKALDDAEDALLQCIVDMNDTHPRTGTLDGLRRALSISTDAASEQLKAIRAALAEWEKP